MIDNDRDDRFLRSVRLIGVGVPFWTRPGFAIPLFNSHRMGNNRYVQIANAKGAISGFRTFNDRLKVSSVNSSLEASIGDQELFGLLDLDGCVHVGTRPQLVATILKWIHKIESPLTRVSFARFCGDRDRVREAASEAIRMKAFEFGNRKDAAIWFVESVLVVELLNAITPIVIVNNADEIFQKIRVAVRFDGDSIDISLTGPFPSISGLVRGAKKISRVDSVLNFVEMAREATQYNVKVHFRYVGHARYFAIGRDLNSASDLIAYISSKGRQEERLALVIESLLSYGDVGYEVLNRYTDRALFARSVIGSLRQIVDRGMTVSSIELLIAQNIRRFIRESTPYGRGRLLWYLADVLGDFGRISDAIESIVSTSKSVQVMKKKADILDRLNRGN